ncbi:MAG: GAF domain-containing sensor histidine kinase [Cyanothece sp. SIO1E1]|nr:GAF domain-containing sensor histidine kinase [Cyanothece sp. SIO1E1]
MTGPESRLFCRCDGPSAAERDQQRLNKLAEFDLLESESVPVFEEVTQTVAHFLGTPICILSLMGETEQWFKSAVGLSRLGLMNALAASRRISRQESFCTHVVDSQQVLILNDTITHPAFEHSILAQEYGIRAYLGVPLITSSGDCLGTLAVMDLVPRDFTMKDVEFLELNARWSMSEFERDYLQRMLQTQQAQKLSASTSGFQAALPAQTVASSGDMSFTPARFKLIAQLTQELRTPLTSIMGMTSVLSREIYGPLADKQKEYIHIVRDSGQYLLSLVNEILELGALDDENQTLQASPVDVEMLCQQAIKTLEPFAHRREQQIRLSVEPGPRIWQLYKDKVRQLLYHLTFSVIQASDSGSVVRIHVSRKEDKLNIAVWIFHPWLGDGLPQSDLSLNPYLSNFERDLSAESYHNELGNLELDPSSADSDSPITLLNSEAFQSAPTPDLSLSRADLALALSQQLAELHGGKISIQGSPEAGYRYVVSLPQITD